jgi:hypothetical protein
MNIPATVGIDLAKNVSQAHGANERGNGKPAWEKQARRRVPSKTINPRSAFGDHPCVAQHGPGYLAGQIEARRNPNVAAVALADKTAKIAWALLARDREF